MFSAKEHFASRLKAMNSFVSDSLDFDFSSVTVNVNTVEEFNDYILNPFYSSNNYYYRGERINSPKRRLVPTMLRDTKNLIDKADFGLVHIDSDFMLRCYNEMGSFVDVFRNTMGRVDSNHLYEICAFAQHYCNFSPLIDFSKSLYPSLSFALKDRKIFDDDVVLYVLKLKNQEDYTNDINIANQWLSDLNIYVTYFEEKDVKVVIKELFENKQLLLPEDFKHHLEQINAPASPTAKLIDVPTNTRMKFQKGVFLLLNDFHLFKSSYFTKNIRDNFIITKYVISKEICPKLVEIVNTNAPWYSYKYLTDIEGAFKTAIDS